MNKAVIEDAKLVSIEDCLKIDGGELLTDYLTREIGKAGYLKFSSPINFDPSLGAAGEHTLDSVRLSSTRRAPATAYVAFGETHPVVGRKVLPLRRQRAIEAAYIPMKYLYPGQPTMIDIMSFVVTAEGVLLMALPNKATERWPVVVVKAEREAL